MFYRLHKKYLVVGDFEIQEKINLHRKDIGVVIVTKKKTALRWTKEKFDEHIK